MLLRPGSTERHALSRFRPCHGLLMWRRQQGGAQASRAEVWHCCTSTRRWRDADKKGHHALQDHLSCPTLPWCLPRAWDLAVAVLHAQAQTERR